MFTRKTIPTLKHYMKRKSENAKMSNIPLGIIVLLLVTGAQEVF